MSVNAICSIARGGHESLTQPRADLAPDARPWFGGLDVIGQFAAADLRQFAVLRVVPQGAEKSFEPFSDGAVPQALQPNARDRPAAKGEIPWTTTNELIDPSMRLKGNVNAVTRG